MNSTITTKSHHSQSGAVSIFLVVFFALLVTIITIGFVQIALRDQGQAGENDLSRSAYDSALAGVEDAKRAVEKFTRQCAANNDGDCPGWRADFANADCSILTDMGVVAPTTDNASGNQEVQLREGVNSADLNQAYTCVNINLNPADYIGEIAPGDVKMIPLKGLEAYTSIEISWSTRDDIGTDPVDLGTIGTELPPRSSWPENRPALLRTQLIRYGSEGVTASQFDDRQNSSTGFLYPSRVGATSIDEALFTRSTGGENSSPTNGPTPVSCNRLAAGEAYDCRVTINLSSPVNQTDTMYLALSSIYNNANYRIMLKNATQTVRFNEVQVEVDSTGRADTLFRRVLARVETAGSFPFPENAVDLTGNLCKNFRVTSDPSDYETQCRP